HSFPPGGLELRPLSKEALFFKVCYRQISRPLEDDGNIMRVAAQKTTNHAVRLSHADGGIKVESPWWAIYHDKKRGGLIASVKFTCASGRNILSGPETLYLFSDGSEYSSVYDRDPSFLLDGETLTVKGGLKSVDGKFCGVTYVTRYEYSDICVKRNTVFYPRNAVKFNRLGVVKLDFIPMLDDCGYKPIVASFKKAIFPGASLVNGSALGFGFLSVFKTGGEGMDFVPGADVRQWRNQITSSQNEKRWQVCGNDFGGASIIVEPFASEQKQAEMTCSASFDYYYGLPQLNHPIGQRNFPMRYPRWWFKEDWVDENVISAAAQAGVTIAIDGNYGANWAGEPVPQRFTESERKTFDADLKRVKTWQKNGVKVVPFIGKGLIKNKWLTDPNDLMSWSKMGRDAEPVSTPWDAAMMCHCSDSFNRFYKSFLVEWRDAFDLNGFYFDFCYPQGPCFNFNHAGFEHSDVDALLEFMRWGRAKFDVLYGHTGYAPTIMCENLVDLTWVGEEINYWYSNDGCLPDVNQMRQYFCRIPNVQKIIDPFILSRWRMLPQEPVRERFRYTDTDAPEFFCRMALCGLFSEANLEAAAPLSVKEVRSRMSPWFESFALFKGVDGDGLRFKDWRDQNAVITGNSSVKASIYWNLNSAYLIIGNPQSVRRQTYKIMLRIDAFGWTHDNDAFEICRLPTGSFPPQMIPFNALTGSGVSGELDAYEYRVYKIRPIKRTNEK
ncbi:MAG: hypothetical protein PHV28_14920, partial [Kiritimatiellae bacterium]|nr:hypothetical protein [Kiritimatiellia bacterium]